jgi:ribosomal protein S18 acetylase RimI-like enzyme
VELPPEEPALKRIGTTLRRVPAVLTFRRAQPSDVPAIVALVESAYRGEASRAGWTTEADLLDGQRTDAAEVSALIGRETEGTRLILGHAADELVCSALLAREGDAAYLGMIAVRPGRQGLGIGAALLAEAERVVRAEQLGTRLRMSVIAQRHELIAWYERRGFRQSGATEPFPYGDPRFGLPRRPDLYFRILVKELG